MATATARTRMTFEEYMALPEDERVDRLLINGVLWEFPVAQRNRYHCRAMTKVAKYLDNWLDARPKPRGQVLTGDAGVRLADDVSFGVDVMYVSAEVMGVQDDEDSTLLVGLPELAVEIISPGELYGRHQKKIDAYLAAEIKLIWALEPIRKTVTAYRPGADPVMIAGRQPVTAANVLPGFSVPAADLFG